jgi:tyrosine-protein phosphatase non-receptor type 23
MQGRWAEAERNKKDLVTRLGQAAQTYGEVRLGLQKGIQFYQDLGELVDGLRQQVSSYLQSRDSERTQMASSADIKQRLEGPRVSSPPATTLDRQLGAVDLGPRSPPVLPPQPSSWVPPPQAAFSQPPGQPSYSHPSYAPPPPSVSPYSDFPTSGPFSPSLLPPPKPYGVPPLPPSFASPPTSLSPYGQLQQQQRQSSFPLPSQPVSYGVLPPPSAPVSYGSYALPAPQQSAPYPPQGTYQYSTPPLLPSQPQSSYAGAPQYGQQQATRPYHPNPPAPPRPY